MSQNINEPVPGFGGVATATGPFDRPGVIFASQVRSLTGASGGSASGVYNSQEFYNPTARGVRLNLLIAPTGPATGTVNLQIQVPSPALDSTGALVWTTLGGTIGANAFVINGTGALTGATYTVYPMGFGGAGATGDSSGTSGASGGSVVSQHLGPRWRVSATVALASVTFTVGGDYLL